MVVRKPAAAAEGLGRRLDAASFAPLGELIEACQEYAALTGGRFLRGDRNQPKEFQDALAKAEPVIEEYRQRILFGEQVLLDCIHRAYDLVMKEGVRNGIVATCRELQMWPPRPAPPGVSVDDCCYEDTTAAFPVIAQRAYNDEQRRQGEAAMQPLLRRSVTASFLSDFASEIGVGSPTLSESHHGMLQEFMSQVEEWSSQRRPEMQASLNNAARRALLGGLGLGAVADTVRQEVQMKWSKNWETPTGTAMNIATAGLAIVAGIAMMQRATRRTG